MYSLLIDTHSNELSIVIFQNGKEKYEKSLELSNHSKYIIPTIQNALADNNIIFSHIKEIIVVNGPGSFTGVRIGVTIAKTLAYCLDIPIKSISSLLLQAINVQSDDDFSTIIKDNKGYYVGKFTSESKLVDSYFYISNTDFQSYKDNNKIFFVDKINWNLVYEKACLTVEDYYNIKPLYIKKIEVEK